MSVRFLSPVAGLITSLNSLVDRAIGADGLKPAARARLLKDQLVSLTSMTPLVVGGTVLVTAAFLMLCWGKE